MLVLSGFCGAFGLLDWFPMAQALFLPCPDRSYPLSSFRHFQRFHDHFLQKRGQTLLDTPLIKERTLWD